MKGKISIIVPVYNVEKYLDRCIKSIINQTYNNLEIILVDDGSPDNCPAMCDEWAKKDKRIIVIHKKNTGVSNSRNIGLDNARGDYIAFVDADDYIEKTMYEKMISELNQNDSNLVFCFYKYAYENKNGTKNVVENNFDNFCKNLSLNYFFNIGYWNHIDYVITDNIMGNVWRVLFSKNIIKNIRFREDVSICEDLIFLSEVLLRKPRVSLVKEYLYYYLQRQNSVIHNFSEIKMLKLIKAYKAMVDFYSPLVNSNLLMGYKYHMYANMISDVLLYGEKKNLKKFLQNNFIKTLNIKNNYVAAQKNCRDKKYKLAYYLIYHKFYALYKLLARIAKK